MQMHVSKRLFLSNSLAKSPQNMKYLLLPQFQQFLAYFSSHQIYVFSRKIYLLLVLLPIKKHLEPSQGFHPPSLELASSQQAEQPPLYHEVPMVALKSQFQPRKTVASTSSS